MIAPTTIINSSYTNCSIKKNSCVPLLLVIARWVRVMAASVAASDDNVVGIVVLWGK